MSTSTTKCDSVEKKDKTVIVGDSVIKDQERDGDPQQQQSEQQQMAGNGKPADESLSKENSDQEFVFIHDTGFTVKIVPQGVEPFEIQVRITVHVNTLFKPGCCTPGKLIGTGSRNPSPSHGPGRHVPSDLFLTPAEWCDAGQLFRVEEH